MTMRAFPSDRQARRADAAVPTHGPMLLQRQCTCGASGAGECEACAARAGLQTRLSVGAANDPLEHQADRIADQVLAGQTPEAAGDALTALPGAGGAAATTQDAPASVRDTLASPGRA